MLKGGVLSLKVVAFTFTTKIKLKSEKTKHFFTFLIKTNPYREEKLSSC